MTVPTVSCSSARLCMWEVGEEECWWLSDFFFFASKIAMQYGCTWDQILGIGAIKIFVIIIVIISWLLLLLCISAGSPSYGGNIVVYVCWHKPTEHAHSFLFCSWHLCLYNPFNCICFHKFSWQFSIFSLCSSGVTSALLVLWTICLFVKVSFSPDITQSGWLGSKHQSTN